MPITRWLLNIVLFFSVNILNNQAFGYKISVPVHIILRSGGSVTTIVVGWLWGKRFTRVQVVSVACLTVGVIIAAMSDAQAQVRPSRSARPTISISLSLSLSLSPPFSADDQCEKGKTSTTPASDATSFLTGLAILLFAQILSAVMGLYIQSTYAIYGSHWRENLFYSHFLSLPLFIPFAPSMLGQFAALANSPPQCLLPASIRHQAASFLPLPRKWATLQVPSKVLMLGLNSLTQLACIRGVNLLAAKSSALTVTIVLNVRKLVSLFLSIWLFGNRLAPGVLVGAAVVFGSGLLYAWEGSTRESGEKGGGRVKVGEEKKAA